MLNPRLLAKADEWKNPEVPKPRKDKPISNSGLTQILERDKDGKPKLDLTPIEKTVVNTPTQEDYWDLMRVYELTGWKWGAGGLPTQKSFWDDYKENTCIEAGVDYPSGVYNEGKFGYFGTAFYQDLPGWNVITTQEFYQRQNITPEMLNEVNVWFDRK